MTGNGAVESFLIGIGPETLVRVTGTAPVPGAFDMLLSGQPVYPDCGVEPGWDENGGLCDDCAEDEATLDEYTRDVATGETDD